MTSSADLHSQGRPGLNGSCERRAVSGAELRDGDGLFHAESDEKVFANFLLWLKSIQALHLRHCYMYSSVALSTFRFPGQTSSPVGRVELNQTH